MINVDIEIAAFSEGFIQDAKRELIAKNTLMPKGWLLMSYESNPNRMGCMEIPVANYFRNTQAKHLLGPAIAHSWDLTKKTGAWDLLKPHLKAVIIISDSYYSQAEGNLQDVIKRFDQTPPSKDAGRKEAIWTGIFRPDSFQGFYYTYGKVNGCISFGEIVEFNEHAAAGTFRNLFPKNAI